MYDRIKERGESMPILNSQFTPDTTIILLKGVECDAMNNTYWGCFRTPEEQYNFYMNNFENQKITYDNYTFTLYLKLTCGYPSVVLSTISSVLCRYSQLDKIKFPQSPY